MEHDRINFSEGIDINKTGGSSKCITCHYWHFLGINFRFQLNVCDGCRDMTKTNSWVSMIFPLLLLEEIVIELTVGSWLKVSLWIEWNMLNWLNSPLYIVDF